ncbi:Lrp/AsnC family transcriptional regulator [Hamadaea tsunoensis]|uniref:Lrp/AsnC family transcriptional regulator n=1 Tax=Hamadaea tsunoensis TaxID=53368 RepID=UPI0004869A92|nr:AsnC family transcriptional regulator [Hamadaea tsunoensis]
MADSDFDELDRKLLHALQIDGRAPFNKIAEVLGVSDQTIARRYARLRSTLRVRVAGRTDPALLGEVTWFVRIRCVPSVAASIGAALARRPDTSWVKLASGGTEIVCVVRAATGQDGDSLLLAKLPKTPSVTAVSANCILHVFYGGTFSGGNEGVVHVLSPGQIAQLAPPPVTPGGPVVLDDVDRRLLESLRADGRVAYTEMADDTGLPLTTVRRRIAELRGSGVLYFDLDLDYRALNLPMQTMLWLSAAPDRLTAVGEALAGHPEVAFAAAVTGTHNVYASVLSPDPATLYTYLATRIGGLPGIQRVETVPVLRTLKHL